MVAKSGTTKRTIENPVNNGMFTTDLSTGAEIWVRSEAEVAIIGSTIALRPRVHRDGNRLAANRNLFFC